MINNIKPQFEWAEETKSAMCILTDGKRVYTGIAQCHPEDEDMANEKTGCEIAYMRAKIEYFKSVRDNELKPGLRALKQVVGTMNHSKKFNPKSYENKMLWRQIRSLEFDLAVINEMLVRERKNLREYISEKEKFYQCIRINRKLDALEQNH